MLSNLTAQPQDKILALMAAYRADPRETKIDLGVGVYKDATGATPFSQMLLVSGGWGGQIGSIVFSLLP